MSRLLAIISVLLTLLAPALAQGEPDGRRGDPGSRPAGPPVPGGPRASGPRAQPLSFGEARSYAARAAAVARQLQPGSLSLKRTPQGQRLSLSLTFLSRPVARVVLRPDLSFAERPAVPLLTDAAQIPAMSSAGRQTLSEQVGTLLTSGLAQAAGPQVRVALLWNGAAVGELRFDRASGILLAEPPGRGVPREDGPDRGRGGPAEGGSPDRLPEKRLPGPAGK